MTWKDAMNTRETIIEVAHALGWNPTPLDTSPAVQIGSGIGPEVVWPSDPIKFAAYAKAEMAKRGAAMRTGKSGVYVCTYGPGSGEGLMTIRSHHACDHTDPISVAEAELRCIADALQSNSVLGRKQP